MSDTTSSEASPPNMGDLKEELKQDALGLKDSAQRSFESKAEVGKEGLVKVANSASAALGAASTALSQDTAAPEWLSSGFNRASSKLADLAAALDGNSAADISQQTTRFARENPAAFLAASAAAGFMAARVFRAGVSYRQSAVPEQAGDPDRFAPSNNVDALGSEPFGGTPPSQSGQFQ